MENTHNTQAQVQALGRGTIGFNADGTCFGQVRIGNNVIGVKGQYNAATATLEGPGVVVNLAKANPTRANNGPAMRGSILFTESGEIIPQTLWRPKNEGAVAYGLTDDKPFVPGDVKTPF